MCDMDPAEPAIDIESGRELTVESQRGEGPAVHVSSHAGRFSPRSSGQLARADEEELAGDRVSLVSAYEEVQNELWVENDPLLGAALRQWEKKLAYFDNSVYRRQKKTTQTRNQIYNLVGIFSLFQGILLVVVSLLKVSNGAHCRLVWSPLVLSLLAACGTFFGVSVKLSRLRALELSIRDEKQAVKTVKSRIQALQARGREFRFFNDAKDPKLSDSSMMRRIPARSFATSHIAVLFLLLVGTGFFIVSYFVILYQASFCETGPYMKRVSEELDNAGAVNELVREFLLLQGVRFAFRVHQFAGGFDPESMRAFETLRACSNRPAAPPAQLYIEEGNEEEEEEEEEEGEQQ